MKRGVQGEVLDGLSNTFSNQIDWDTADVMNTYTVVSANLINFLPMLDAKQHRVFYQEFMQQQVHNGQDLQWFEGVYPKKIAGWDMLAQQLRNSNGIIATYHFGPFQLINYLLVQEEIPYVLLVAGQVIADWEQSCPQLLRYLQGVEQQGRFHLLDANDSRSLRTLYKLLDRGFSLLIYTDGIEGIDAYNAEKLSQVNFLGQEIHVPRGTALLSHRFDMPILPCLFVRHVDHIKLEMGPTIWPAEAKGLPQYTQFVADRLFAFLAKYVMHWPQQWTNWSMLHRFLVRTCPIGDFGDVMDDPERFYGLYVLDGTTYLFEKHSYRLFPLDKEGLAVLRDSWC